MIWIFIFLIPIAFATGIWVGLRHARTIMVELDREWKMAGIEIAADWLRDNTDRIEATIKRYPNKEDAIRKIAQELENEYL